MGLTTIRREAAIGLLLLLGVSPGRAQLIEVPRTNLAPALRLAGWATNGWLRIQGDHYASNTPPQVYQLQASPDLRSWREVALIFHTPFEYLDPAAPGSADRFYRFQHRPRTATNDWANQLRVPGDPFLVSHACNAPVTLTWCKFAIPLDDPGRVYFQDCRRYPLHYEFAVQRLPGFVGMTAEEFDAVSAGSLPQRVVLGVVLVPRASAWNALQPLEYGIQFVGRTPYPPESIARWMELVRSTVVANAGTTAFYVPTFEQVRVARLNEAWFASRGIPLAATDRWSSRPVNTYAPGWAVGRLAWVTAPEISAAYADGRLGPQDVLLTDAIPAEIPYVAGILSMSSATPASHVAILAANYGVPFVHVADRAMQQHLATLIGRDVAVRTGLRLAEGKFAVRDVTGLLSPEQRAEIEALKHPRFQLTPKARFGAYVASTTALGPGDLKHFGGKAAHFGVLRRAIPEHSPEAIAFSFDLWDDFMDQTLPGGQTLRDGIQSRLSGFTYPADVAAVRNSLAAIRDLITGTAHFTLPQQETILTALSGFNPARKIRFRSSTNVEDSESFTGAGLYDSYSGCLADDLDGDAAGPCLCDPGESNERGVFRAIRKVFASFYNDNAYLERLRLGVEDTQAGMALLVHHSAPDEMELANGVVTATVDSGGSSLQGELVLQPGAASVTNPDNTAAAEIVAFHAFSGLFSETNAWLRQGSSLLPLGTHVMRWPDEYHQLIGLVFQVARAFPHRPQDPGPLRLDLEFKKLQPGALQIKQVRQVPRTDASHTGPVFLIGGSSEWMVRPGPTALPGSVESPDTGLMAMHRLKSTWQLDARSTLLARTHLANSVVHQARAEFASGPEPLRWVGSPTQWPEATFGVTTNFDSRMLVTMDGWRMGAGTSARDLTLVAEFPSVAPITESPWRHLDDMHLGLEARYQTPVPARAPDGSTTWITRESVQLFRTPRPLTNVFGNPPPSFPSLLTTNPITLTTSVERIPCQPPESLTTDPCSPEVSAGGVTYHYVGGEGESRLAGLLEEPLVLRSYAAQTLWIHGRTGHEHVEELILDPWLEPTVSESLQAKLAAQNIRLIHFRSYDFGSREESITVLGLDGVFRRLAPP